jgi:hypothetical protein
MSGLINLSAERGDLAHAALFLGAAGASARAGFMLRRIRDTARIIANGSAHGIVRFRG